MRVAEGGRYVIASRSVTIPAASVWSWYDDVIQTEIPALRDAPGNVAIVVLRNDHGNDATITILSEWTSRDELDACRRAGACRLFLDESEVLFEAFQ
jgi:quinol monooxygenase YgiN